MRYILFLAAALFLFPTLSEAQRRNPYMIQDKPRSKKDRDRTPWLDTKVRYARSGWFVEPGITYTLAKFKNETERYDLGGSLSYDRTVDPNGRFGLYIGGGRYRINKNARSYWDYGLALKMLNGRQLVEGAVVDATDNSVVTLDNEDGKFREVFALANLNYNHIIPIGQYYFIQNSLGINFDYRLDFLSLSEQTYEDYQAPGAALGLHDPDPAAVRPDNMRLQLHYKLGWGIKVNKWLMVIPTVETPILNIIKFEDFKSTHLHFNSRYRPLIGTVRFLFMRDSNKVECPPVYGNPDDKAKQDGLNGLN